MKRLVMLLVVAGAAFAPSASADPCLTAQCLVDVYGPDSCIPQCLVGSTRCAVDVGVCEGNCTVNIGYCASGGHCQVNVGYCDDNDKLPVGV